MTGTPAIDRSDLHVLTFDLYGTIVDMQAGLVEVATPFLEAKGWEGSPHRFVTWWRRTHFQNSMIDSLCDTGHTAYREIGERAVSEVLDRLGLAYEASEVRDLVASIERLKPFDDVVAALERLGTRYGLVILSNGDRDMLAAAEPHLGFRFDRLISVQEAGYFKPHRATYETTAELVGQRLDQIMHVANHPLDCIGAKAAGMRSAYVDRRGRPFGETPHVPDLVVGDFRELADVLTA